ncbi:MAG: TolC family protein [Saprospiraceae bacterium]
MRVCKTIILILFINTLQSQTPLTLKEAVRIALNNNYGIKLFNKDLDIAKANNNWTNAGAYPSIKLTVNPSIVSNSVDQKFVNNTEINRKDAVQKNINSEIQLNYDILNGFKVFITKDKLKNIELLSQADLELKVLSTYHDIAIIYYQILSLQNSITTLKSQEKIAEERKSLAENKFNLGQTGKNAFLEASIDQNEIIILVAKQNQAIKESYASLYQLMNVVKSDNYILIDSLDYNSIKLISKVTHSIDGSIEMKKFQLRLKIQELEKDEIKAQRYPNLNVLADYHYNRSENQAGFNLFSQSYGPGLGLQVTMPLYSGKRINKQLAINSLEADKIKLEESDWSAISSIRLKQEEDRMIHQLNLYELEHSKLVWAQENIDILRRKFELGEANSLEYSQALFKIIQINASENDALFNFMVSNINVNYLTSMLVNILN